MLIPIADRIIFGIQGNHGYRSVKSNYLDPERDICRALGAEYYTGFVCMDVICQDYRWEFYAIHGRSNAQTPQGRMTQLMKKNQWCSSQFYLMGHVHDLQDFYDHEVVRDPVNLTLKLKKRYYVITGTTQEYFDSYAYRWALQPNKSGFARLNMYCDGSDEPGDYDVDLKW